MGAPVTYKPINFQQKFSLFTEQWAPKVVAEMNEALRIDFRDGAVTLRPGEMFVVPKGVEHKPYAESEVKLLLIEPRGVPNTGEEGGERTAQNDVWI
jgi:hypothetical protein